MIEINTFSGGWRKGQILDPIGTNHAELATSETSEAGPQEKIGVDRKGKEQKRSLTVRGESQVTKKIPKTESLWKEKMPAWRKNQQGERGRIPGI